MTLKLRVLPHFPSKVLGNGIITVIKANGIWTIAFDPSVIGQVSVFDPSIYDLLAFNSTTGEMSRIPLSGVIASSVAPRTVVTAGSVLVTNFDTFIRLNKTVPATTSLVLPPSANRNGLPLTVKDVAGNASTYNFSITPNGSELIDGLASYIGSMNFQSITLVPGPSGWDITHSG
jgi:hypothetical protein